MDCMDKLAPSWSVPVAVDDIAETGLHMEIEAPAETRAAIAALAGVRDVTRLSAVFDVIKQGARVELTGRVRAAVGQTCVVTLEPIENNIEETVALAFAPLPAGASAEAGNRGRGDNEPPEPLVDGVIDLGAVATEFLLLGIDPYPHKEGAQFAAPRAENDGPHPFAALEALKKRQGSKGT
jgi:Large ribosomal RNA subunit accumulation protein YceD